MLGRFILRMRSPCDARGEKNAAGRGSGKGGLPVKVGKIKSSPSPKRRGRRLNRIPTAAALALLVVGLCAPHAAADPVIMAAGDIACPPGLAKTPSSCHHKETSDILVAADPN